MRRPVAYVSVLLAALMVLSACKDKPADTGYVGPFKELVDGYVPMLEAAMGQRFLTPPKLEMRSREEVRGFLERQITVQLTPLELVGMEQTYKRFGVIPDSLDLRSFYLDLLSEQVSGYYDPETKVLYVVDDGRADFRSVVIGHELVHALQDQHFPLDSSRSLKGDNDRQVAFQAVVEGQALYEQVAVAAGGNAFAFRLPGAWDRVREDSRAQWESMPIFSRAPAYIQEMLLFPYMSGAEFIRQLKERRPGTSPFAPLAASTEQILHPERLLDSVPDVPTHVTLGEPRTGSLIHEDNLGEFETRLFLYEHLRDVGTASNAARGWDGDRYQLVEVAGGDGLAWLTVWDDRVEAAQFRDAMERMVERRFRVTPRTGGDGDSRRWSARGRRLQLTIAEVAGRPAVVWEDLPAAASGNVIDLRRVSLREN